MLISLSFLLLVSSVIILLINSSVYSQTISITNPPRSNGVYITNVGATNLALVCTVNSATAGQVLRWFKGNLEVATATVQGTSATATNFISTVMTTDLGEYRCVYQYQTTNLEDRINVLVPPEVTLTPSTPLALNYTNSATIQCSSVGSDELYSFYWFFRGNEQGHNGQNLNATELLMNSTDNIVANQSTLQLTSVNASHGGVYECLVFNEAGANITSTTVNINPYFVVQQVQSVVITSDQPMGQLNCSAEGFPTPSIQWEKRNEAGRFVEIPGAQDRYYSVSSNDFGEYRCVANASDVTIISQSAIVSVSPQVMITPNETIASRGNSTTFTCVASAGPATQYIWLKNTTLNDTNFSQEDISNLSSMAVSNSSILSLANISAPNDGGTYQCIASNDAGYDIGTASLYVTPSFITHPQNATVLAGLDWSLTVETEAFPMNSYQWQRLTNGTYQDITGQTTQTLLFEPIRHSDQTEFRCITTNTINGVSYQVISMEASITVKPVVESTITSTSLQIVWGPPDNTSDIINYTISVTPLGYYRMKNTRDRVLRCYNYLQREHNITVESDGDSITRANLTSLVPYVTYQFIVRSITSAGSFCANPQSFSTLADAPGPVINLMGTARTSSSIVITWLSPPCPNSQLSGYHIYYRERPGITKRAINNSDNYINETIRTTDNQMTYIINGLTSRKFYQIHVRAFSDDVPQLGDAIEEITVELKTNPDPDKPIVVTDDNGNVISVTDTVTSTISSINVFLPSDDSLQDTYSMNNISYYGIAVVRHPDSNFNISRDDFNTRYANIQPYYNRGSMNYYITAGWNDVDSVPVSFRVGDKQITMAERNGTMETYYNAKLSRKTSYCVYIIVHGTWNMTDVTIVRISELVCAETRLGYNLVVLIVMLILAILIICCCLLLVILCCCCYRRRKRRENKYNEFESSKKKKSSLTSSIRNSFRKQPKGQVVALNAFPEEDFVKEPVSIYDFPAYVAMMHGNADYRFSEEFTHIEPKHLPTRKAAFENKDKNRYMNIVAYDHSRVILQNSQSGSDYINANYIPGYEKAGSYIATQGPLSNTVSDFWCMVWEKEISTIVMLTNLIENDKVKCHQYWPTSPEENTIDFYPFKVTLLKESIKSYCVIRELKLTMANTEEQRIIEQYHFISWPNHGAPTSGPLLEFIDCVSENYVPISGPMLVHCSSGAGRAGTFIALLIEMARIRSEKLVDIFNCVHSMRTQRPMMVMNETEYIFIHDALVEFLKQKKIENVGVGSSQPLEGQTNDNSDNANKIDTEKLESNV